MTEAVLRHRSVAPHRSVTPERDLDDQQNVEAEVSESRQDARVDRSNDSDADEPDSTAGDADELEEDSRSIFHQFLSRINIIISVTVMTLIAIKYTAHLKQLHENEMWFSNIEEVEREISFRTESGLYYSYYKQMVEAPTIKAGIFALTHDNRTEHPATINVLARMNVYQELVVGALYQTLPVLQTWIEPVYWYIDTVFCLQGVMLCALYVLTWLLSRTWIASVLMCGFYIFNREDITRVSMTIPLRENWSLPFFYLQMLVLSFYLRPSVSQKQQVLSTIGLYITTFLFSITWQFNQFVLFLQALALFACQLLDLLPQRKICTVYAVQVLSMFSVCALQFGNPMILSGLLMSFVPAAVLIMWCQNSLLPVCRGGFWRSVGKVLLYITLALYLLKLTNSLLKAMMSQDADDHIYRFILAKLGWNDPRDFDVSLYLCNGAFQVMSPMTFVRLSYKLVFPIYVTVHTALLAMIVMDVSQRWMDAPYMTPEDIDAEVGTFSISPPLSYHSIQCVLYGMMAFSTMRMKYFWTPYMCVLASVGLSDEIIWAWLLRLVHCYSHRMLTGVRYMVLLGVLAVLLYIAVPPAMKELEEMREFYDPDTVELMNWIKTNSSTGAAFSGSMQLLAGVKLCTGRHITNHPHYEDKHLRLRTRELYQFYSRSSPEDVHRILQKYEANFIILEDSICLSRRPNCRLTDIIDLVNGIVPERAHSHSERDHSHSERDHSHPEVPDSDHSHPELIPSNPARFCDQVRHGEQQYSKYFQLVFENKTFRVYKVL